MSVIGLVRGALCACMHVVVAAAAAAVDQLSSASSRDRRWRLIPPTVGLRELWFIHSLVTQEAPTVCLALFHVLGIQ